MLDSVVVGAGIAGTTLALYLKKTGRKVGLISDQRESASHVAAGIINPLTGRDFNLSWNYAELIREAKWFYSSQPFENHFTNSPLYRAIKTAKDYNQWTNRSTKLSFADYGKCLDNPSYFKKIYKSHPEDWLKVSQGGRLDIPAFLKDAHQLFRKDKRFFIQHISGKDITVMNRKLSINDIPSEEIYLAEGASTALARLPSNIIRPAKGEVLWLRSSGLPSGLLLKFKYFLVHLYDDLFWLGSNYERDFKPLPSQIYYQQMTQFLEAQAVFNYKIVAHRSGVRPTVKDRRPVIGRLPDYENVFLFNGMGSKGSSLAPWSARQLIKHIDDKTNLPPTVDIARFLPVDP